MQMLASFFFVGSVYVINMKLSVGNKLLGFMGGITLEFYLIHGFFLELFSYEFCEIVPSIVRITNVPFLIIVVLGLSIPSSLLLKKLINLFRRP